MSTVFSVSSDTDLRYPVGRFRAPQTPTRADRDGWIGEIEQLHERLAHLVSGLAEDQLDTPYRPGGWTVRQVVHHLADSHLHSYTRFRLAVTEQNPTIKPYDQAAWAELPDARTASVDLSLQLLRGLHTRWVLLLRALTESDWAKTFVHPEHPDRRASLEWNAALYAWHCRHHLAHIERLRERSGW